MLFVKQTVVRFHELKIMRDKIINVNEAMVSKNTEVLVITATDGKRRRR